MYLLRFRLKMNTQNMLPCLFFILLLPMMYSKETLLSFLVINFMNNCKSHITAFQEFPPPIKSSNCRLLPTSQVFTSAHSCEPPPNAVKRSRREYHYYICSSLPAECKSAATIKMFAARLI